MSGSSDARDALNSGRETLGVLLKSAQLQLRKVFVLFLVGLVGTIYFMRNAGWDILKDVTTRRMSAATAKEFDVIVRTPFDVILLQVKLGLVVGIFVALPLLVYYARQALIERGKWPFSVSPAKAAFVGILSVALFTGGLAYAYFVFFPVMFNFLTNYTLQIGFQPTFDIVKWTQFILLLTISFGLAAQLPLVMSGLSYANVVPYEFFREKWRHATLIIFLFGALFSPPDPFTQIMWAIPLLVLYGISLYITKFTTAIKRGGSTMVRAKLRRNWYRIVAPFLVGGGVGFALLRAGALQWLDANVLSLLPAKYYFGPLTTALLPGTGRTELLVGGALFGAVVAFPFLVYYAWPELQPRGSTGDPYDIDFSNLSASGVRAAPIQAFANMEEDEAVDYAREAMDEDDGEKAQLILDRFDEAEERAAESEAEDRSVGDVAGDTALNIGGALTGEDTDEDELGGYAYDAAFVLDSLTSKSFRIVGLFMTATMLTFFALYGGAFKLLRDDFFSRLPPEVVDKANVVALHPVEALLFEVKMSLITGVVVSLPALMYYAWPAVEERVYGITRSFETPAPSAAVRAHWNKVAAVGLLGAVAGYVAASESVSASVVTVTPPGLELAAQQFGYAAAGVGALAAALPVMAYYAWPSLRERWGNSKRTAFLLWAGTLTGGLLAGSAVGYVYVAPEIISYLVTDVLQANMVIKYTISNFFWLVFATTVGIGLLANIPITMWLFHRTGIVSYRRMYRSWRGVVFVVFVAAAVFTDRSIISMFLFGIPVTLLYWSGLASIWATSLPRRALRKVGVGA